eukprot:TRINITY_DN86697_c0_g1_i1.p2 TRINITY_DN86697_c0_g1~~TRINITY_DN86697_c0_g1_i1.p2  ORF type:complete len:109 (+),score=17.67 TRINITY_DN86697_c0_g1_i1:90-416(+)
MPLSKADKNKVKAAFQAWDVDGDGVISKMELTMLFVHLFETHRGKPKSGRGYRKEAAELVDAIFLAADKDRSGSISIKEFLDWCLSDAGPGIPPSADSMNQMIVTVTS